MSFYFPPLSPSGSASAVSQPTSVPSSSAIKVSTIFQRSTQLDKGVSADSQLRDLFYKDSVGAKDVLRLIPNVSPDTVQRFYKEILSGRVDLSDNDAKEVLEHLLQGSDLTETDKKMIFTGRFFALIDHKLLLTLYMNFSGPEELFCMAALMNNSSQLGEEDYAKLFQFCWEQHFKGSLFCLAENPRFPKLDQFISMQLQNHLNPKIVQMILRILPNFSQKMMDSIFSHFGDASLTSDEDATAFFLSGRVSQYFTIPFVEPTQLQLHAAFSAYWRLADSSDPGQMRSLQSIAGQISHNEPEFITEFVKGQLHVKHLLLKPIAPLLDFLDDEVALQLDEMIANYATKNPSCAYHFIEAGKKMSLMIWRHSFDAENRNYKTIFRARSTGQLGPVNPAIATTVLTQLNASPPKSIQFNQETLQDYLEGGTCSAMTLRTLKLYLKGKSNGLTTTASMIVFGPKVKTSNEEFRSIQSAYNTIERRMDEDTKTDIPSDDFSADKVNALLHYELPGLNATPSSTDVEMLENDSLQQLTEAVDGLNEGVFIARSLRPLDTHKDEAITKHMVKEEQYGHTTFLIKEQGNLFYYDPGIGSNQLTTVSQLHMLMKWQAHRWGLPETKFYQVA